MGYSVLGFGAFATLMCYLVLRHHDNYWMSEAIAIMSVPIVLTVGLFLVVSNAAPEVSKELIGLLSAVVGYVFGLVTPRKQRGT